METEKGSKAMPYSILVTGEIKDALEYLARELHESARPAFEKGLTVAQKSGASFAFREWDEIPEEAREGRRMSARYLLSKFIIAAKVDEMPEILRAFFKAGD